MADLHKESCLIIPNDISYLPPCLNYVRSIAELTGFDARARLDIEIAVEEAVSNVIRHAFSPEEDAHFEVKCRLIPLGIEVIIHDEGMPYDPGQVAEYSPDELNLDPFGEARGLGQYLMKQLMDEMEYCNLGGQGKEVRLRKYLPSRSISDEPGQAGAEAPREAPKEGKSLPEGIVCRSMEAGEAIEVSRCFFTAYGYSYIHEDVYYPERLAAKNASGDLYSAVAIAPGGEVVSHAALIFDKNLPGIAEIGMGATKPCYQGNSVVGKLSGLILSEGANRGLNGFYSNTVTVHPYSQKVVSRMKGKECAFFLAHSLNSTQFKGISESRSERSSVLVYYLPARPLEMSLIYPPLRHQEVIQSIYNNLGREIQYGPPADPSGLTGGTAMENSLNIRRRTAVINFSHYESDLKDKLKEAIYQIKRGRIEVAEAFLNLNDPLTPCVYDFMEELGFIFTGIMPGVQGGDRLVMQYFNGFVVDYDSIALYSDFARGLLQYIRQFDVMGKE